MSTEREFSGNLDVRCLSDIGQWLTLAPFSFGEITVPAGFQTDLASVPKWFTWLIPINDKHRRAAVVHDYLYTTHNINGRHITRKEADAILFDAMCKCHEMRWRRQAIWLAVRLGGRAHWDK